jgi:hypothetical protein
MIQELKILLHWAGALKRLFAAFLTDLVADPGSLLVLFVLDRRLQHLFQLFFGKSGEFPLLISPGLSGWFGGLGFGFFLDGDPSYLQDIVICIDRTIEAEGQGNGI